MISLELWRVRIGCWRGNAKLAKDSSNPDLICSGQRILIESTWSAICNLMSAILIKILLIIGGVELNPGPGPLKDPTNSSSDDEMVISCTNIDMSDSSKFLPTWRETTGMEVCSQQDPIGESSSQVTFDNSQSFERTPIHSQILPVNELDLESSPCSTHSGVNIDVTPLPKKKVRKRKGYGARNARTRDTNKKRRINDEKYRIADNERRVESYRKDILNPDERKIENTRLLELMSKRMQDPEKREIHNKRQLKRLQDPEKRDTHNKRQLKKYTTKREHLSSIIDMYKTHISEGPTFICSCCGCLHFRRCVVTLNKDNPRLENDSFKDFLNQVIIYKSEGTEYVCRIALCLGLTFPEIPVQLLGLTTIEQRLISPRHEFMNIRSLGRERQSGLHGMVVNVPIDVETTVSNLPRTFQQSQTIQLQLFRKISYSKPYLYETVRPSVVLEAARYLSNTELFKEHKVVLSEDWVNSITENSEDVNFIVHPNDNTCSGANATQGNSYFDELDIDNIDHLLKELDDWDETKDDLPINPGSLDTLLLSNDNILLKLAPGEGRKPLHLVKDEFVEELAYPCVFSGVTRDLPEDLSILKKAKSDVLRYDRRCSTNIPLLFLKYKLVETASLSSAINICMRKTKSMDGRALTVFDVLQDESLDKMIENDEAFKFLKTVRSSPAFWQAKQKELMSMIRQIGCPTFFLTLSAAETKWPDLIRILKNILDGVELSSEQVLDLHWSERADLIRRDPVTCARYFDHRSNELFKVLRTEVSPLGLLTDYYLRIEFQQRGSPHIHSLLWIQNAPKYGHNPLNEVIEFIDRTISCSLPVENSVLSDDDIRLQSHKHTHTCYKKRSFRRCRFGIPYPPMLTTKILEPIVFNTNTATEEERLIHASYRKNAKTIYELIDEYDKGCVDLSTISIQDFLTKLKLTEEQYLTALKSCLTRPTVFLKRNMNELRINAHNDIILHLWQANMDIQYILDPYACAVYIISYIGKSQRGMSKLLRDALLHLKAGNTTIRDRLRGIAYKFQSCSEVSAQEVSYHLLSLPLSQCSRANVYINTNPGKQRVRILKPKPILLGMELASEDIL